MKKPFLCFGILAAGAMLLLSSCDKKENGLEINSTSSVEFIASMPSTGIDAVDTKTTTTDGTRVLWCNNDHVSIFRGRNVNDEYKVKDGHGGKTTTTFVWANDGEFSAGSEDTFDANIAYYPYGSIEYVGSNGNHALSVTIPNTQRYVKGSFGEGSLPMIAVSSSKSDNSLAFKNVFGLLKLQLKSADETVSIKEIVIKGNNNEKLSGEATVSCSANSEPTISFNTNAGNSITLECNNTAINATTATDFWIALPPVTFSKGITVEIVTSAAPVAKKTSAPLTITRSKVKPMEEVVIKVDMKAELDIPDPNFKRILLLLCDMDGDGRLTMNDVDEWNNSSTTAKVLDITDKGIESLKGIEYFSAIKSLRCPHNAIRNLDLSKNTNIEELDCSWNCLISLDLGKNTALTSLICNSNNIAFLDISNSTALVDLKCDYNKLTSIDVSNNINLKKIEINNNQIKNIDLSKNLILKEINCSENRLYSLDISLNTALTKLYCSSNEINTLNIVNCTKLKTIECNNNFLTSIDFSKNVDLSWIECNDNYLRSLDISCCRILNDETVNGHLRCRMLSLEFLYLKRGAYIQGINGVRSADYISDNTKIIYVD